MLTIVIQAGGQSSRMGEDKALKPFLGKPLIQRVMERLNPIADEMIITTNQPDSYSFLQTRLVPDLITGRGALGGLLTAISSASHPFVGVVACDMPFANPIFFETAHRLMVEEEADVVIPRIKSEETQKSGGYEPLHALYRKETCLPAIEDAIQKDLWKVIAWFGKVKVRDVSDDEMKIIDPSGLYSWNVNTPDEFVKAEEIAKSDGHL
ncbi:MAG: molybdenum cofactor guanylyltransferase [Anaerolineales bacterium]|nr:molybdenum cofactor guanylyltransferase [Anaerolineales bacterium]